MCGRYSAGQLSLPMLAEQFQADPGEAEDTAYKLSWNVVPTSKVLVITAGQAAPGGAGAGDGDGSDGDLNGDGDGDVRRIQWIRWGLVPNWAKDAKVGNKMINVRAESVADKPTFKRLLAGKRCVLPADGFYEWQDLGPEPDPDPDEEDGDDGKSGKRGKGKKKSRKQPFYVTRRDGGPLALAGLWTVNKRADPDNPMETCTILTTSANKLMSSIHHRMPVILPEEAWDTWLDPAVDDVETLTKLLVPAPEDMLQLWPVDPAVSSPRSNHPDLTRPLEGHAARTS